MASIFFDRLHELIFENEPERGFFSGFNPVLTTSNGACRTVRFENNVYK